MPLWGKGCVLSGLLRLLNQILNVPFGDHQVLPLKEKDAFHARYGCTITQYIQGQRMERAERLLANTDLPVGQIAQIVGYQNPSRFAQLFRRNTGQSPAAFRAFSHPREAE
ncbi:helix-turn-helix transcriptional regulator [Pseudoflavonifractor sp. An184]|uniref:helix-turn-helix transcriptional regulator n=2 Tax=Oscillospiraceae TaxID=216572 RepID=UPI0031B9C64D